MESMNPGGTGKDRAAKYMLAEATKNPLFGPGCELFEGTSGSTGIALACQCRALGLQLNVVMPDDQVMSCIPIVLACPCVNVCVCVSKIYIFFNLFFFFLLLLLLIIFQFSYTLYKGS